MERLHIKLLGGFSVTLNDQPVTGFRSAKTRALLAYVAAQPDQEHPRARLATILWGDLPDTAASTNLRNEHVELVELSFLELHGLSGADSGWTPASFDKLIPRG